MGKVLVMVLWILQLHGFLGLRNFFLLKLLQIAFLLQLLLVLLERSSSLDWSLFIHGYKVFVVLFFGEVFVI